MITLTQLKFEFHVQVHATEHKIRDTIHIQNIEIPGYHEFIYDSSETSRGGGGGGGGTGFFVKNSLAYNIRNDLKLVQPSSGEFESTFLEIVLPGKKNLIIGCIYRHPSSNLTVDQFNNDYIEPLLQKISAEDKICSIMGDFNIDLLKTNTLSDANQFFNTFSSNFFTPYILQPTRPISKTLIDNIFLNSIDFTAHSGNLTIQLSDHLFQFAILEGFFKDLVPRKLNLKKETSKILMRESLLKRLILQIGMKFCYLTKMIPIFKLTNFIHK